MNVSDYFSLKGSPSPRPSPPRRGRTTRRILVKIHAGIDGSRSQIYESNHRFSLSPRERVRVRGNAMAFCWGDELQFGILDCGGKRSTTPLSGAPQAKNFSGSFVRAKAVSPLRSATALQDLADARFTHYSSPVTL